MTNNIKERVYEILVINGYEVTYGLDNKAIYARKDNLKSYHEVESLLNKYIDFIDVSRVGTHEVVILFAEDWS